MQSDLEFLDLAPGDGPGRFHFTVEDHLARIDGKLYGGTAIAASIAASELFTGRSVLWTTTQFVSTAPPGADITVTTEALAEGRRTTQVRVTGTDADGQVMFASLGAMGVVDEELPSVGFERRPDVAGPDEAEPWTGPWSMFKDRLPPGAELPTLPTDVGFHRALEFRAPEVRSHPDPGPGRMSLWVRRRDGGPATPAIIAFMADMVPLSVSSALGVLAIGMSLDNTIRVGRPVETDWVLLDLRPHLAHGNFGHGVVHVWTPEGDLLATASQTAAMRVIDVEALLRLGAARGDAD
jgi:acyl-CoA thioesterase